MLSVIIPTLNEEKYLPILLSEIKTQTRPNFASQNLGRQDFNNYEIIVADAGSEDKTVEIAKSYGCKIVKGGLPAKGRNEGAKIAKGEIFLFMDADNIFLPENFLKNLLEEFNRRNLEVASFPICPQGNGFDKFAYGIYNWWAKLTQSFLPHATNSILVKREVHFANRGFDEEIKIAEDHFYVRKAKKFAKFGFIKTAPVLTSTRRFEREGRLKTYLKYFLAGLYMLFFGPIKSDIFKYRFNDLQKKKNEI